jgi:hypothetical protein
MNAGMRHLANHFAGGGVDHIQRLAAGYSAPFVVDEELCAFVDGCGVGHSMLPCFWLEGKFKQHA